MAYTVPTAFNTKLSTGNWSPCYIWSIEPESGSAVRFCDNNESLLVDLADGNGTNEYLASLLTNLSEVESRAGIEINTHEIEGASLLLSAEGISRDTILGGSLDGAIVKVAVCDRDAPSDGAIIRFIGYVTEIEYENGYWNISIVSLLKKLETEPFKAIAPECDYNLGATGSPGCNVKGILSEPSDWTATTAYTASADYDRGNESLVKPTTPNGYYYYPSTGGTSGGSEPTWPTTPGGTVSDGSVTWTCIEATRNSGEILTIGGSFDREFTIDLDATDNLFSHGKITFTSGRNDGKTYPILSYKNDTGTYTVTMVYQPFLPLAVGDTFTIIAGCSKNFFDTTNGCQAFRNQVNFPGFPYVPGVKLRSIRGDKTTQT